MKENNKADKNNNFNEFRTFDFSSFNSSASSSWSNNNWQNDLTTTTTTTDPYTPPMIVSKPLATCLKSA